MRRDLRTLLCGYALTPAVLWPFYIFEGKMTVVRGFFIFTQLVAIILVFIFKEKPDVPDDS